MKLHMSTRSPYVRKVRVVALEAGLDGRIERILTDPHVSPPDFVRLNPLSKIPVLALDDGTVLFDSPVICEYLDSLNAGARLFPPAGAARWTALRQQALADGILDAAVLRRGEMAHGADPDREAVMKRQETVMARGVDALDAEVAALDGPPTIGTLTAAVALGYLDFRFGAEDWRAGHPQLAAWFERFSERPSLKATVPHDG